MVIGRLPGAFPRRRLFYVHGSVSPVAKRADCKSVTIETPKVRLLPGPLYAPVPQWQRGSAKNRFSEGSTPSGSTHAFVAELVYAAGSEPAPD